MSERSPTTLMRSAATLSQKIHGPGDSCGSIRLLAWMRYLFLSIWLVFLLSHETTVRADASLAWAELPPMPNGIRTAGTFAGVSGEALLVAGGNGRFDDSSTNSNDRRRLDEIYVLTETAGSWRLANQRLPRPLSDGVSLTMERGVVCLGGRDADRCYPDVFLMKWENDSVRFDELPSMPRPLSHACGAVVGQTIYVAGGTDSSTEPSPSRHFWALDLSQADPAWREMDPWPGRPRMLAVAGALDDSFYLFGGLDLTSAPDGTSGREHLPDAYRFDPGQGWRRLADLPQAVTASPSPAWLMGPAHLGVFTSGQVPGGAGRTNHFGAGPGSSQNVIAYHAITDTWAAFDSNVERSTPDAAVRREDAWPASSAAVSWNGVYAVPDGGQSARGWSARIQSAGTRFGAVNFAVLFGYLGAMVGVGFLFARRNKSTDDFFRGGKHIPWWVAGLSIFATMLSSLTYMSVPAKAFATNWEYLLGYPFILLTAALVVWLVLPFFRRIDATSAYEYLEKRFHRGARLMGSGLFILFQTGRMAIVMFLSALALRSILGLPVGQCILLMGLLSIVYSTLGGVEAVVWTDAAQAVVLLAGAVLSLGLIVWHLDGGVGELARVAAADGKFHMINWDWDAGSYAQAAFWVLALGALGQNLSSYTSDQAVVQRYMTTPTQSLAARSIWTNGWMAIPAGLLFFTLGTALYVFYKTRPERLDPTFATDAIFPLFITRELPAGLAGLVVAGIFAAAQSTISTSMNSMATAFVTDFCRPFRLAGSERAYLRLARWATLIAGTAGTILALVFSSGEIKSLLDQFFAVLGLFGGALGGMFLLGMFTRRANAAGAMTGAAVGAGATYWVQHFTQTHVYLHAGVGMAACVACGRLVSWAFPKSPARTDGLTVFTSRPEKRTAGPHDDPAV